MWWLANRRMRPATTAPRTVTAQRASPRSHGRQPPSWSAAGIHVRPAPTKVYRTPGERGVLDLVIWGALPVSASEAIERPSPLDLGHGGPPSPSRAIAMAVFPRIPRLLVQLHGSYSDARLEIPQTDMAVLSPVGQVGGDRRPARAPVAGLLRAERRGQRRAPLWPAAWCANRSRTTAALPACV